MIAVLSTITFGLHILTGLVALVAGIVALCVRKGGRVHRLAGDGFVVVMLIMATSSAILGVIRPGQSTNIFIAGFTFYLVATCWMADRGGKDSVGAPEITALIVSAGLCIPFALLIFQIVTGVTLFKSAFIIRGPILIALCVFSAIMATASIGDLRVVAGGSLSGTPRIARHLWRMCLDWP